MKDLGRGFKRTPPGSATAVANILYAEIFTEVSIYMQQKTSADNIFRCIFFVAGEGLERVRLF